MPNEDISRTHLLSVRLVLWPLTQQGGLLQGQAKALLLIALSYRGFCDSLLAQNVHVVSRESREHVSNARKPYALTLLYATQNFALCRQINYHLLCSHLQVHD